MLVLNYYPDSRRKSLASESPTKMDMICSREVLSERGMYLNSNFGRISMLNQAKRERWTSQGPLY
jgi:hypothetical protein